jgi:hypothetical protein
MPRGFRRLLAIVVLAAGAGLARAPAQAGAVVPVETWAYYYIWFNASSWNRAKLDYPLLGRYSSDEASVARQHIRMAKRAGIDGFIVSWKSTPVLDQRLAQLADIAASEHFALSIIYQGLDFQRRPQPVAAVAHDLGVFQRRFARLPAFRSSGKPLVIWSGTWEFSPRDLDAVTSRYRPGLRILASERHPRKYLAKASAFDGDAYYWSSVNPDTFPGYATKLQQMGRAVHSTGGVWFAPAAPGFDGTLVGHPTVVPRDDGLTLRRELDAATRSNPDAIALISWNEFSENSHIEPSKRYGATALRVVADVHGAGFNAVGDIDSSEPGGRASAWGAITPTLALIVGGLGTVLFLGHRRRTRDGL